MSPPRSPLVGTFGPRSADEMVRLLAEPEARRCGHVELRLDLIPDAREHLRRLIDASPVPVLATCRRPADGGGFHGTESQRLDLLAAAVDAGVAWVDVEEDVPAAALRALDRAALLRSSHVPRLPPDPEALVDRLLEPPAAAGKLVALDGGPDDALRLMTLVAAARGRLAGHVVSQRFSRFASWVLGAPFVYAALRPGGRLGLDLPGVPEMLDAADLGRVGPGTRAWVLIGGHVEESVSPQMLNHAFREAGRDVVALRWSTPDPSPLLTALVRFGWEGGAVTIPHKEAVHAALGQRGEPLGAEAAATGAVNTLLLRSDGLAGENTDVGGLIDALTQVLPGGLAGRTGLVLGAGGAARAAVFALRRLGGSVRVHARRRAAAAALRDLGAEPVTDVEAALAAGPAVVVDATPAGPPGGAPFVDLSALPEPAVVLDMLVHARPTALLDAARRLGHVALPGVAMLAAQAARQVELLSGARPDAGALRTVGERLLRERERRVVLLGLRCSGKSSVGRRLADLTGRPFVDADEEVAARAGRTPDEMIAAGDEAAFRDLERSVLRDLAARPRVVVATGGGAALSADALDALCVDAHVVLLDAPAEVLLRRLAAAPRAALSSLPPERELARQRAERMPIYESRCRCVERTDVGDARESAERLAAWVARESETTATARG